MSLHAEWNRRPRTRALGVVTGVALLLGGGFAAQAVADVKPAPAAPKVTATTGDAAVSQSAGTPKVADAGKPAAGSATGSGQADNAPKVINPGSGVKK